MQLLNPTRNIAARMGRWSASHRKVAILGWLAFVIAAGAIGSSVGMKTIDQQNQNVGQAHRADQILKHAGFVQSSRLTEIVVIQSKHATIHDPAFRAAVSDVASTVAPFRSIHNLRTPLQLQNRAQISSDGHTALVEWDMSGKLKAAEKQIDPLTRAMSVVAERHPGFYVGEAGSVSSSKALDKLFNTQLALAGSRSVPLTLIILVLVFGSLVAAWLPLMLALEAVAATVGLVSLESHLVPMDQNVSAVVLLIGLAVGVDYTLFYLKREREERAAGNGPAAALDAAAATSGRSVLISGATVMIAMAGMLFSGDQTFRSFSIATMTVVAVAMIGSLTVLPALLSKLGDRVEKGRIPLIGRLRRPGGESRAWSRILTPVLRRPAVSAIGATVLLVAMAIPTLDLHTAQSGLQSLPRSAATVATLNRIQSAFPGQASPAVVVAKVKTDSAAFRHQLAQLQAAATATGRPDGAVQIDTNSAHTVARISIPLSGSGVDATSTKELLTLRNLLLPRTIGTIPGASYAVTGQTAGSYDWNEMMKSSLPIVFGFVLTFAFLLLLASFRSLVIAIKAVVLTLLSVAAAYGVVVAVFQYGWGERLLNFKSSGAIAPWLPMFMFVILFGLSMDYHVFILSRVREAFDRGLTTEDAVAHGIKTTAGTVTGAAIVMIGAFAIFATLPILEMKEMGVGLAAAVLIDSTIVRGVLLPATMKLLGDWNWYLPTWLDLPPQRQHPALTAGAVGCVKRTANSSSSGGEAPSRSLARADRLRLAVGWLEDELAAECRGNSAYEAMREQRRVHDKRRLGGPTKPYTPPPVPQGEVNLTDPDSRRMKGNRRYIQGDNAQAVVNEQQIVIAAEITTAAGDCSHLRPMIETALHELEHAGVTDKPSAVVADAQYWNEQHMDDLNAGRGLPVLIPPDGGKRDASDPAGPAAGSRSCDACSPPTSAKSYTPDGNTRPSRYSVTPNTTGSSTGSTTAADRQSGPSGDSS